MSKKVQKGQTEKKQIEIVEQQKDPMLRALQKKVRNINKKLNEIVQLSAKKDLKPEQEQKISKKNQIVQEKEKYLQMIEVYKQISTESEKIIRKTQLAELEDLAHILVAKEYSVDLGAQFNQGVDNLVKILATPSSNQLNLKQRVDEIFLALSTAANNLKLKKNLRQFVQANPEKRKEPVGSASIQPEPLSSQSQKDREAELKELEAEENQQQPEKTEVVEVQVPKEVASQPTPQEATEPLQVSQPQKVEVVEEKTAPLTGEQAPTQTQPSQQEGEAQKEGVKQERRGYRGYRGREKPRGERNGEKFNDETKPYKKRTFKPKFENEQPQRRDSSSSSSSSGSEPKARQFKREEVRELIEDGFIVVGKPKLKAKDKEQKEYYDHQHGKKHHHHHSKKNF